MKFENLRIGDVATFQNGFAFKSKDFIKNGKYKIIKIKELKDGLIKFFDDSSCMSIEIDDNNKKYIVNNGDVLFALTGDPVNKNNPLSWVGRVSLYNYNEQALLNQRVCKLIPSDNLNPLYLYYFFRVFENFYSLASKATGSASQANISTKTISDEKILLPCKNYQNKIVSILSAIDDKIELNQKINTNLEQQAQAIFKSWFVDFEPFGGVMPADWRIGTFSDITEKMIAGDWGKDSPNGNYSEKVYCIRGADIPDVRNGNKGKMPTRYILEKNYIAKHLADGDIVVEISGGSPTQSTGRVAVITQSLLNRYNKGMICTNFCKAIKPIPYYSMFMYYYWQYLYNKGIFFLYENGTTGIKNLDISSFIEMENIVIPSIEAVKKFNNYCCSVFDIIFTNGLENEKLSLFRDTLLPKLMSGEIDVSEVEV